MNLYVLQLSETKNGKSFMKNNLIRKYYTISPLEKI